jgi:hypothetical protein
MVTMLEAERRSRRYHQKAYEAIDLKQLMADVTRAMENASGGPGEDSLHDPDRHNGAATSS